MSKKTYVPPTLVKLVRCEHCGKMKPENIEQHAPRWFSAGGLFVKQDCAGNVIDVTNDKGATHDNEACTAVPTEH